MSDSNWDWWFGDGPLVRRVAAVLPKRLLRSKGLRRWLLSITVLGGHSALISDAMVPNAVAEIPQSGVVIAPVSFGWASPGAFSMLVAEDNQADEDTAAVKESADEPNAQDENERRRQRLRDLLGDDGESEELPEPSNAEPNAGMGEGDSNLDVFAEPFIEERLPEVAGGRFLLPPLRAVSIDQKPIGNGKVPEALNAGEELTLVPLPEDAYARSLISDTPAWPSLVRPWAAPNTFSHPLYFEDRMLERHGHERWGCLQPIAAGARFFATVPMLPYLSTIQQPCETVYSKGYFRSGSPAPRLYQRPPLERRAVIAEAAAIAGGFIALP